MKNKLKLAAIFIAVVTSMVFYKRSFDRWETEEKAKEERSKRRAEREDKNRWN